MISRTSTIPSGKSNSLRARAIPSGKSSFFPGKHNSSMQEQSPHKKNSHDKSTGKAVPDSIVGRILPDNGKCRAGYAIMGEVIYEAGLAGEARIERKD